MAVRSAYYIGTVGLFEVVVPELAYRKIVSVKREGTGYNIVSDPPVGRQVQYTDATGGFRFENAFTGTSTTIPLPVGFPVVNEKIFIIWDE